ncbi:lycopene cyclase domain-containing protein [Halovivax cerinus]|uniref:Lycopene cyclase domain-containing protein n=1 Tax=Halovivax cerinus TaxID=1487865 RepID=A0ABD5NMW8_9EURY|nr:lycopene cyclase domain-containing protein [Halovivax cerinus]
MRCARSQPGTRDRTHALSSVADRVPGIDAFGRYTYLVTEIFWGIVAFSLLRRADALRAAARTIVVLYPIAYVWDRYTLAVGVFSIDLRTGVDVLGIPVEEHVFMIVVPGLVVGIHDTIHGRVRP